LSHASQFLSGRLAEEMVIGALQLVPSVERLTTSAWFGEPSLTWAVIRKTPWTAS